MSPAAASGDVRHGQCHCGAVRFEVTLADGFASVRRCDCSYCRMRGAVVVLVPKGGIKVVEGAELLTSYRFHTRTAEHFFCSLCGIYTHHQRRSTPDAFAVNVACLEGISPFDFAEVPVVVGAQHPADSGEQPRVAGRLLFHTTF